MSIYELNFEVCCSTTLSTAVIIQRLSRSNEKGGSNGGMMLTGENRSTHRKDCLLPLCSPQIPHRLARDWTMNSSTR